MRASQNRPCQVCGAAITARQRFCTKCGYDTVSGRHTRKGATVEDRSVAVMAMRANPSFRASRRRSHRCLAVIASLVFIVMLAGTFVPDDPIETMRQAHHFGEWLRQAVAP